MSWSAETNIKGPAGPQGPQGPPGTSGTGSGNVSGPTPPVIDNRIVTWNGTTATAIKDSGTLVSDLAPINSPVFTGDPQAPTPATADNDTSIATTAFVKAQGYLAAVPATYAPLASPTFTGDPKAPTPTAGDNDTSIATTAFVSGAISGFAPIASPTFTGVPAAPTATVGTNTTQLATTAFVLANGSSIPPATVAPIIDGVATIGVATKYAREDHVHPSDVAARAVRFDTAQALTAAQKAQGRANIDALKKNYIINGAMMISQENAATAGTTHAYYPVDQFNSGILNTTGVASFAQVASVTLGGSPSRLRVTVTTADAAVAAGDVVWIDQKIEGLRVAELGYGSAAAKTTTLQFGVKAPAGTYSIVFLNATATRSYVAEYVIAAGEANNDVVKSVTIPGDTLGVWVKDSSGSGLGVRWGLMVGSTYQQAAGAWAATNMVGSPNQFNFMGTVNNVFELFDVGLYEGSVAPAFQVPDYASELALCQRYFYNGSPPAVGVVISAAVGARCTARHPVPMRAIPGVTLTSNLSVFDGSATGSFSSLSGQNPTTTTLQFDGTGATGLTIGRPAIILPASGGNLNVTARL